jgi:Flp pilus assembly protein TadD
MRIRRTPLGLALAAALSLPAAGATAASAADEPSAAQSAAVAAAALKAGNLAAAHAAAERALQRNPGNAELQFLNGLAYHLAAAKGDAGAYDLARVGYESSLRFDPNAYWPAYMLGALEFERGDWREAQEHFSAAALKAPDDWRALSGLAAASYYAGDSALAWLAAERAAKIAPREPQALRIAALTADAAGDDKAATRFASAYAAAGGARPAALTERLASLSRTAGVDAVPDAPATPPRLDAPDKQMTVEVTIILSEDTRQTGIGLNLLDGLRIQYSYDHSQTMTTGGSVGRAFQRIVTQKIAIPEVDYSLNIFNRNGEDYHVLARPTLSAFLGQPSEFFAGRDVSVEVSGVNLGSLQTTSAGVRLKLTPLEIEGDRVKFTVDAERSFFSPLIVGTIDKQINVFKQTVSATAELDYGQTMILSGLSETFYDRTYSVAPPLGDAPIVGLVLGRRDKFERQTSVMILVTPLRPLGMRLPQRTSREGEAAHIVELWTSVVEPTADLGAITDRLSRSRLFTRAERDDLSVVGAQDAGLVGRALAAETGEEAAAH